MVATATKIRPLGDRVVVKIVKEEKTAGGLVLPDTAQEKPQTGEGWINGAFFVFEPEVFDYIEGDDTQFEREPLENLAKDGQLMAFQHAGFWQCMDTIRDRKLLDELWENDPPWRVWD